MIRKIIAVAVLAGMAGSVYAADFNDLAVNAAELKAGFAEKNIRMPEISAVAVNKEAHTKVDITVQPFTVKMTPKNFTIDKVQLAISCSWTNHFTWNMSSVEKYSKRMDMNVRRLGGNTYELSLRKGLRFDRSSGGIFTGQVNVCHANFKVDGTHLDLNKPLSNTYKNEDVYQTLSFRVQNNEPYNIDVTGRILDTFSRYNGEVVAGVNASFGTTYFVNFVNED